MFSDQERYMVRFEGLSGEFFQHDFGQRRVCMLMTKVVLRFFASRLKYSRYVDLPAKGTAICLG